VFSYPVDGVSDRLWDRSDRCLDRCKRVAIEEARPLQAARAEGSLMLNFIWLTGVTLGLFLTLIGFGFWLFPHHYLDSLALCFGVPGVVLLVGAYLGRP
jgi:hypothetical protein